MFQGDSGGPLTHGNKLIGIFACFKNDKNAPAVFADISNNLAFITKALKRRPKFHFKIPKIKCIQ